MSTSVGRYTPAEYLTIGHPRGALSSPLLGLSQGYGHDVSAADVAWVVPRLCLLKIPSEPKLERVRASMSFGCDRTKLAAIEIDSDRDPNMMEQASIKNCVDDAATVAATEINGRCDESRREALVPMVEPADLRDRDDSAGARRLDRARVRAVLVDRKMRPGTVVIVHI